MFRETLGFFKTFFRSLKRRTKKDFLECSCGGCIFEDHLEELSKKGDEAAESLGRFLATRPK